MGQGSRPKHRLTNRESIRILIDVLTIKAWYHQDCPGGQDTGGTYGFIASRLTHPLIADPWPCNSAPPPDFRLSAVPALAPPCIPHRSCHAPLTSYRRATHAGQSGKPRSHRLRRGDVLRILRRFVPVGHRVASGGRARRAVLGGPVDGLHLDGGFCT